MDHEVYLLFRALIRLYDIRSNLAVTLEEIEFLPSSATPLPSGIDPQYYEVAAPAILAISEQIDHIERRLEDIWPHENRSNPLM